MTALAFDSGQPMGAERIVQDGVDAHAWQGLRALAARSATRRNLNMEVEVKVECNGLFCLLEAASLSSPQKGKNAWGDEHLLLEPHFCSPTHSL